MSHRRYTLPEITSTTLRTRLTALTSALAVAALVVAGVVATSAPAQATTGLTLELTGQVQLHDENGDPVDAGLDDVMVTAWLLEPTSGDPTATAQDSQTTDASGTITFDPLPAGSYAFEYSYRGGGAVNVVSGFSDGRVTIEEELANYETAFTEIIEDGSVSLDHLMPIGGIITGHARTSAGAPLAGQPVELWRMSQAADGSTLWLEDADATTDVAGDYLFSSLPSGSYTVRVGGAANYIPEFWEDRLVAAPGEADAFTITTGGGGDQDLTSVLGLGGRITGTVKNTSAKAIAGIVATAYIDNGIEYLPFASALTGSAGTYTISGLPAGSYRVGFASSALAGVSYVDRYWTAAATLDEAQSFTLATGATKSGVNVTMTRGASISGVITLEGGGFPAANDIEILVCAEYDYCDYWWSEYYGTASYNPATGAYTVSALPAGRFTLRVAYTGSGNFLSERYDDVHGDGPSTPVVVATGANATNKNVQLDHGSTISGQVLANGVPRAGVPVAVYEAGGSAGTSVPVRTAISGPTGSYTISGLVDDLYSVRAEPDEPLAWQWSFQAYDPKLAQVIDAKGGNTTGGVSFDLEDGATISGAVTTLDDGMDVTSLDITIYRLEATGDLAREYPAMVVDQGNGHYEATQLPPGRYRVAIAEDLAQNTLAAMSDSPITLAAGGVATADFALDRAGSYVGRVVDEKGDPVVGAEVSAGASSWELCLYYIDCTTDETGAFFIRQLEPGAHTLTVSAPEDSSYVPDVEVTAPATTVNAAPVDVGDLVLENGSSVAGTIVGVDGKALGNVSVTVWTQGADERLDFVESTSSDASGRFTVDRLPSEPVFLEFYPNGSTGAFSYSDQFLGGNFDWTLSESVPLPVAGTHAYREVRLLSGAIISGVVTNKATGAKIPGVGVRALLTNTIGDTNYGNFRQTNTKGAFSLPGMEPGSYTVSYEAMATGPGLAGDLYTPATKTVFAPERGSVDASIALTAGVKLSGVLRDGTGAVVPFGQIDAHPTAGNTAQPVSNMTDDDGSYSFYLAPGQWILHGFDYTRHGAGVFSGGAFTPATATPITLDKVPVVSNLTLPTVTSKIHADSVFGTDDPNPTGTVVLQRVEGGDVVSTEVWNTPSAYARGEFLGDGFTLDNVTAGEYRVTVRARSLTDPAQRFDDLVIDDVEVLPGETFELGDLDLGAAVEDAYVEAAPVPGSEPTLQLISPALQVGGLLHVDDGTWTGDPTGFRYTWLRNGRAILGATDADYVIAPGDAGASISVRVDAVFGDEGTSSPGYLAEIVGTVAAGDAAFPLDPPIVTGTPRVGQLLTASKGTWNLPGVTIGYQWLRGGTPIAGATAATYKPVALDVGAALSVRVSAVRPGFVTGTSDVAVPAVQPATAMARTKAGVVTATADGWKVTPGTWVPASTATQPTTFGYAWRVYDDDGAYVDYPGAAQFVDGTTAPAGVKAGSERVSVLITAHKTGYTSTTIEVPVRVGPVPGFGDAGAAQLSSTGPGGAVQVGYPISLDGTELMDPKPADAVATYQWARSASPGGPFTIIAKATSTTYTPVALDVGKYLSVAVTLKAAGRTPPATPQQRFVFATGTLPAQAFVASDPVITGDPTVGSTLTADPGTWDPAPTTFAYQWLRNGATISGATKATYTLVAADSGKTLTVRVTGSKSGIASLAKVSPAGVTVGGAVPFVTAPPTISGDPHVGRTLTAVPGVWTPAPTAVTYQWYRSGVKITGATKAAYVVVAADDGKQLTVRTTGTKPGLPSAFSEASVTIGAALPTTVVTPPSFGTVARVGAKLTANPGKWLLPPTSYLYQWYLNGLPIGGATASTYTPIIGDLDSELSVTVIAKKSGFPDSLPASSESVTVTAGAAISASKAPVLSVLAKAAKTVKNGQTIATTAGTWPVAALSLSYQWQVDRADSNGFVDLEGAVAKTLYIDPDGYLSEDAAGPLDFAAGFTYRVVVSAERVGYLSGPDAISAAVTHIP